MLTLRPSTRSVTVRSKFYTTYYNNELALANYGNAMFGYCHHDMPMSPVVCLPIMRAYCDKTAGAIITPFSLYNSPMPGEYGWEV